MIVRGNNVIFSDIFNIHVFRYLRALLTDICTICCVKTVNRDVACNLFVSSRPHCAHFFHLYFLGGKTEKFNESCNILLRQMSKVSESNEVFEYFFAYPFSSSFHSMYFKQLEVTFESKSDTR